VYSEGVWWDHFQYDSVILLLCTNIKVRNFFGVECILKSYMYDFYSVLDPVLQTVIHMECSFRHYSVLSNGTGAFVDVTVCPCTVKVNNK
jgi:hypothetical protein